MAILTFSLKSARRTASLNLLVSVIDSAAPSVFRTTIPVLVKDKSNPIALHIDITP
jgi:hypothetical protein